MLITCIKPLNKYSKLITLDNDISFFLYNKEIDRLKIVEGIDISEEVYRNISDNILFPRAREKALTLLESSPKSTKELSLKLMQKNYPNDVIDRVVSKLLEYNFLNDEQYAQNYIETNIKRKSIKQIRFELVRKGVNSDIISNCFDNFDNSSEDALISKIISRYSDADGTIPPDKVNKLIASLYRKGFNSESIFKIFKNI